MSADNYAVCPKCTRTKNQEADNLEVEITKIYGVVSPELYMEKVAEVAGFRKTLEDKERTVREDWDLGIHEGEFFVSYSKCDFRHSFKHEDRLEAA